MKNNILFATLLGCLISISCKDNYSENNIEEDVNTITINDETKLIDENFPITDLRIDFKKYEIYGNIDGPSMNMTFSLKNKTTNKISNFKFQYYIKAIFDNGETMYFPNTLIDGSKEGQDITYDDELILDNSSNSLSQLTINDVWETGVTKQLNYVVGHYMSKGNFKKEIFNRTPKSLEVVYKYNATSIDKEYSYFGKYDILNYWKDYQIEIGLRTEDNSEKNENISINSNNWKIFNHKYGFTIELPENFKEGLLANSGLQWYTINDNYDDLHVTVETIGEGNEESLKSDFNNYSNDKNISYKTFKNNSFVISGTENDNKIYYIKAIIKNDQTHYLKISYLKKYKNIIEPNISRISNSFK